MRSFVIVVLSLLLLISSGTVYAEKEEKEPFKITYDMPLNGIMKGSHWVKVDITIKNEGEAFEGEIVLARHFSNEPVVRKAFAIGKGESQTIPFTVRGDYVRDAAIRVMKNQEIIQSVLIGKIEHQSAPVIGIISDRKESYHFLGLIQRTNEPNFILRHIPTDELPDNVFLLNQLNMIVLDEIRRQNLSEAQAQAIVQWVKSGGALIVTGGEAYQYTQPLFKELLPVPYSGLETRSDLEEILTLSNEKSLPVTSLETARGLSEWINSYEIGNGKVIVPSFDPSIDVLASWKGSSMLWGSIFNDHNIYGDVQRNQAELENHTLVSESINMPGLNAPSLKMIVTVWVVYILLAAPLLYWYLKKRDRREWAWLIIPMLSILLTTFVYFFGKHQIAANDMIYTVSDVNILDSSLAKTDSATSILVIDGGDFTLQTPKDALTMPMIYHRGGSKSVLFDKSEEIGAVLHYENIPYLTLQQAYSNSYRSDLGSFDYQLHFEGDRLVGSITNQTKLNYNKLTIAIGSQQFELGEVKAGETVQVDQTFKKVIVPTVKREMEKPTRYGGETAHYERQVEVSHAYAYQGFRELPEIDLLGVSTDPIESAEIVNRDMVSNHLTYVREQLEWRPDPLGRYTFPYGTLPVTVFYNEGEMSSTESGWNVRQGKIQFSLWTEPRGVSMTSVEIPLHEPPFRPFEIKIYNFATEKWEKIKRDEPFIIDSSNKKKYASEQGEVRVNFTNTTNKSILLPYPHFLAEGEGK
jgi:hypothetical protein